MEHVFLDDEVLKLLDKRAEPKLQLVGEGKDFSGESEVAPGGT